MRKNRLAAAWSRRFRPEPLVPDTEFQGATEPYPGHWRRFPEPWLAAPGDRTGAAASTYGRRAALGAAVASLPDRWREVLMAHDAAGRDDQRVADDLDLSRNQERDILARARAAVRDRLDSARRHGAQ